MVRTSKLEKELKAQKATNVALQKKLKNEERKNSTSKASSSTKVKKLKEGYSKKLKDLQKEHEARLSSALKKASECTPTLQRSLSPPPSPSFGELSEVIAAERTHVLALIKQVSNNNVNLLRAFNGVNKTI
jgi:hypothetical protein